MKLDPSKLTTQKLLALWNAIAALLQPTTGQTSDPVRTAKTGSSASQERDH